MTMVPSAWRRVVTTLLGRVAVRLEAAGRDGLWFDLQHRGVVSVGRGTYGTPRVYDLRGVFSQHIRIGNYCSIAPGVVMMLGGEHRTDIVSTFPFSNYLPGPVPHQELQPFTRGDIVIGHDVWIGEGAFIRSGVTIGSGAVIGARAVVTRDVEPYTIAAGNPCRALRRRFTDEQIAALLASAWWEWPEDKVRAHLPLLSGPDVDRFLEAVQ